MEGTDGTLFSPLRILSRRTTKSRRVEYEVEVASPAGEETTWITRVDLKKDGYMKMITAFENQRHATPVKNGKDRKSSGKVASPEPSTHFLSNLTSPEPTRGRLSLRSTSKGKGKETASVSRKRGQSHSRTSRETSVSRDRSTNGRASSSRRRLTTSAVKAKKNQSRNAESTATTRNEESTVDEMMKGTAAAAAKARARARARRALKTSEEEEEEEDEEEDEEDEEEDEEDEEDEETKVVQPYVYARGEMCMVNHLFSRMKWSDSIFLFMITLMTLLSAVVPTWKGELWTLIQECCCFIVIIALFVTQITRNDTSTKAKCMQLCLVWRAVAEAIAIGDMDLKDEPSNIVAFCRTISSITALACTFCLAFPKSQKSDIVVILPSVVGTAFLFVMDFLENITEDPQLALLRPTIILFALEILVIAVITSKPKKLKAM